MKGPGSIASIAALAVMMSSCVGLPFAPTDEPEVIPLPPAYCTVEVYATWVDSLWYAEVVTDSIRYIGCEGFVEVR